MILDRLNDKQREAATHIDGPLLVLAGAGSGKTATMTARIAYMIEQGISPYNILAVTFTNKAAGEMRERVETACKDSFGIWIMTFHALGLRILRKNCGLLGYEDNFVVYDTVDQRALVKTIMKEQNIDSKEISQQYISAAISKAKERDINPSKFMAFESVNPKGKKIALVYEEYEKRLKKSNAMDFDDLLLKPLHLLREHRDVLEQYQDRFKYVMVDEYQDTNTIQYEIIKLLTKSHHNLAVVGDDDQCIYQWRGADIKNILGFEKDFPKAKVIKLEQNYRSCGYILDAAYSVIKNNKSRKEKKLWTNQDKGNKLVYSRLDSDKEEASYIARQIDLLKKKDNSYDDFAVLYRTNAQSRLIEDALRRNDIPYQVLSGFSFYERKETKDMISYMRLVSNPKDDMAFQRVINEPKRGIGQVTLSKISAMAGIENKSMFEILEGEEVLSSLSAKAQVPVREMVNVIKLCQIEKDNLKISNIYDNLLIKTGYLKALEAENTIEANSRIENLMDFKSFIYDYEENEENPSLEGFLEKVSVQSDQDNYESECGKVTLMTIHSAKGLEFPNVFMPGLEDGLFPGYRGIEDENQMEEERRLCYVGITRAKKRLFLTSAAYRVTYGKGDYTRESTFLRELDAKVLDESSDAVFQRNRVKENQVGTYTGSIDGFAQPAYKPYYDPLKAAKLKSKEVLNKAKEEFLPGDRVTHEKFGFGIVIESTEKTVSVKFEDVGIRKLAKGIAPLKKVD